MAQLSSDSTDEDSSVGSASELYNNYYIFFLFQTLCFWYVPVHVQCTYTCMCYTFSAWLSLCSLNLYNVHVCLLIDIIQKIVQGNYMYSTVHVCVMPALIDTLYTMYMYMYSTSHY